MKKSKVIYQFWAICIIHLLGICVSCEGTHSHQEDIPPTLSIKGQLKIEVDSIQVTLVKFGSQIEVMDSTWVKDGQFHFENDSFPAGIYALRIPKINKYPLIALFDQVEIDIDSSQVIIKGGNYQDHLNEWTAAWKKIQNNAGEIYRKLDKATNDKNEEGIASAQAELRSIDKTLSKEVESFIKKYPNSPISSFVIYDRYSQYSNIEKEGEYFALLDEEAKDAEFGKMIYESQALAAKSAIGVTPAFELEDAKGELVSFKDFRGKYVLVDFWASWCGPCRRENPNLVAAYNKYHEHGFEIIGISLDDKKAPWETAIKKDQLNWTNLSDLKGWNSIAVSSFGIKVVPTSFLLDPDGKIIAKNLRGDALEEKLEELMGSASL
ncbi:AhpC/TSA family protein [Belliella sp. DSM 111904]|uniref:AhpC/TSA family protein n=1 Tax=Belliella filtrata TaxID=2923435 RepID=A0ABS9UYT9_9BACT|nr:TlpA disulfide reductase family protein [Belliella filtrata]MCH7408923.1 AhpC/TSA family protein [Belliella filtrata]